MKFGRVEFEGVTYLVTEGPAGLVGIQDASILDLIAQPSRTDAFQKGKPIKGSFRWLPPIPNPPKFLLLAGNFRAHVVESGFAPLPEGNLTPQFFMKPDTAIIGASDSIPLTRRNVALDYEAEVAVVIGARLKSAGIDEASKAIWGYTLVNDISERQINKNLPDRTKRQNDDFFDWLTGKWFDGSAPMGPWVVTTDEISNVDDLVLRAMLNGNIVQEAPLSAMVHSIPEAIAYISQILTLEPGDVISMGTPAGVGSARGRLLQDGDLIECEIHELGRLSNRVKAQ